MSIPLWGRGMHFFICDEVELGFRVACWLDEENETPEEWWGGLLMAEAGLL